MQIDSACASLNGSNGTVVITSATPAGTSLTGLPNGCHLIDYRGTGGPDSWGTPSGGFLDQILFQSRSVGGATHANRQTVQIAHEAFSGGINQTGGPKTNYSALYLTQSSRTPGQVNGMTFTSFNFSNGDTIGLSGYAQSWGRNNAGGDEGIEGISIGAYQGSTVMTARVTAVSGNLVSYNQQINENTRGEARPLIITTPAKIFSTGNIVAIAGVPPVVTGDGTQDFTTLGSGPVSNLFFSLDSMVSSGLKLVVPVRSITDATHLVLDYISEGTDSQIPAGPLPSTYKIYRGGNVTAISNQLGSVTVVPASDFAIGDTVEQPLGYAHALIGAHITVAEYFSTGSAGIQISNIGPHSMRDGIVISGPFDQAIEVNGTGSFGLRFDQDFSNSLLQSTAFTPNAMTRFLGVYNSLGALETLAYDRSVDQWKITKPISAPLFQSPSGPGVDCNGPPTANYRVSKGIVISC